jgi:hypothetical protein
VLGLAANNKPSEQSAKDCIFKHHVPKIKLLTAP